MEFFRCILAVSTSGDPVDAFKNRIWITPAAFKVKKIRKLSLVSSGWRVNPVIRTLKPDHMLEAPEVGTRDDMEPEIPRI